MLSRRNCGLRATIMTKRDLSLATIVMFCLVVLGCATASPKATKSKGGAQAIPVAVADAQSQDLPVYLTGLGTATAFNMVNIKSRVDGQLVQVAFKEGQVVNKGDLLAVIDTRPFENQLSQAQAALSQAKATQSQAQATLSKDQASLRDVKLNLTRFTGLAAQGVISSQQRDSQSALADELEGSIRADEAAIRADEATIGSAQSQIDSAKLQLTYCHITAPIGGRIGLRLVDEGNIVHAADPNPLLVITQLQPISVIFTLPEDNLPAVARQMRQGTLRVDAYSRDDQTKLGTGSLETIDNQIDQTTGTARLKARFDNADGALWPNQFVNIQLLLEVRKDITVVPAAAIQRGPQGTYIYVVKKDKTVDVRQVSVSLTQGNLAAIGKGISPGEKVVTDGQDRLQADSKVEIRGGNAPGNKEAAESSNP